MDKIRNVFRMYQLHKTSKRIRKLWEEYVSVAKLKDMDMKLIETKLSAFAEQFQVAFTSMVPQDAAPVLDRIYGDCTEMLLKLLELVDKLEKGSAEEGARPVKDGLVIVAEMIDKALTVAELILRV